ncbi:hypothetical protein [Leadbetterella sp. DM7]
MSKEEIDNRNILLGLFNSPSIPENEKDASCDLFEAVTKPEKYFK